MLRRLTARLAVVTVAISMLLLVVSPGTARAITGIDGYNCERHWHTSTEYAEWCSGTFFDDEDHYVFGYAEMHVSKQAARMDIDRIAIYRTSGNMWILLEEVFPTGSGGFPTYSSRTGIHGPCRWDQQYYTSMRGRVRWADGSLSPYYTHNSPKSYGNNHNCPH
jgi:hypothetical protein